MRGSIVVIGVVASMGFPEGALAGRACWVPNTKAVSGKTQLEITWAEDEADRVGQPADPGPGGAQRSSVRIELERDSADSVRGEHHVVILEKDGVEVTRVQAYNIVSSPSPSEERWGNTAVLYLPEEVTPPFVVHADDRVLSHRCSWVVDAMGKIKRLPSTTPAQTAPEPIEPAVTEGEVSPEDAEVPPPGAS